MAGAFVSIGSNVEREQHIREGLRRLAERFGELRCSSVYESPAVGFEGGPFLNLVVAFETDEPPAVVAAELRRIEDACGRRRRGGEVLSRTLDLDLLLYGDVRDAGLRLPRDDISRYAFVLRPLAELAPRGRCPGDARTFADLWAAFDSAAQPTWPVAFQWPAGLLPVDEAAT